MLKSIQYFDYRDVPTTAVDTVVSEEEIDQFKRDGFFVKRGLIATQEVEPAIQLFWDNVPRAIIQRDDPDSWLDKPHRKWTEEDVPKVGLLQRGSWKQRSHGPKGQGTHPTLLNATVRHPHMMAVAEQLLGGPLREPKRVRGIYAILPQPPGVKGGLGPHSDDQASQLSAMVILDNTPPHCGGFTLWPGSHLRLHWHTTFGSHMAADQKEAFQSEIRTIVETITPVEFSGNAGDVVFWHPRMVHSAGVNESLSTHHKPVVRLAVPVDYQNDRNYTFYEDEERGPGEKVQWWVDTRCFKEDVPPTADNMWDAYTFD
ncbi:MAG: phytanoyl-CoA dioxygenase family protein [Pseudomonadota bacterium]